MTQPSAEFIAVLPMRGGSERVPGKNLIDLGGKPLYAWILDTIMSIPGSHVVVDTDDDAIAGSVVDTHPSVTIVRRPKELGESTTSMNSVLANTLHHAPPIDTVLQVHATNPFVSSSSLSAAVQSQQRAETYDSAFSVSRVQARLWSQTGKPLNHDPHVLLRTQDLDPVFVENSSFYAFSRERFLETRNRIGTRPAMITISPLEAVDIDTWEDLEFASVVAAGLLSRTRGSA